MPDYSDEFPLDPNLCYLNHAAVAPWPRRTAAAVQAFAEENLRQGARDYPRWQATEQGLREAFARLLGAESSATIALLKNTSEALSVVAFGLPWQPGDNVVGIAQEFPSNRLPWEALAPQGVAYRTLDLEQVADAEVEAALEALCDRRTRVLAVSFVQYARGRRLDVERLGAFCRRRGMVFVLDAIQGLGVVPLDVQACQADCVMADTHKWLLGPEGVAVFYVRPEIQERLRLYQYGWHMTGNPGDFEAETWRPSASATRFECGSPNMLGIHAAAASLSLLEQVGLPAISDRIRARGDLMLEALADRPRLEVLSPRPWAQRAGICTFRVRDADQIHIHRCLMAAGVICAQRGGGIRWSPHFYTPEAVLDRAFAILDTILGDTEKTKNKIKY